MLTCVLATACNSEYADEALNLVGSVQTHSNLFDRIFVYDLGMTRRQRQRLSGIDGVEVKPVTAFAVHWQACWSWKPWVWANAAQEADSVVYLDAGVEVLRSLHAINELIDKNGYFVVSQFESLSGGHTVGQIIPSDYYDMFNLSESINKHPVVAGGLVGFKTGGDFYKHVVLACLELVKKGYNLGWSDKELFRNSGFNYMDSPPIRDCPWFRHDQTLLNILLYTKIKRPIVLPMDIYGAATRHTHPDQLIWNTRRYGNLAYVGKINYARNRKYKNFRNYIILRPRRIIIKGGRLIKFRVKQAFS
jgi:hypothetical protein